MHNMRDTSAKDLKTKSLSQTLTSFPTCSIWFTVFSSSCTSTTRAVVAFVQWTTSEKGKVGVRILNDVLEDFFNYMKKSYCSVEENPPSKHICINKEYHIFIKNIFFVSLFFSSTYSFVAFVGC